MTFSSVQRYISNNFDSFKNEIIKELINYFGEEYKDIIVSRIEDTNFIFYIEPRYNEFLKFNIKRKDNYRKLKKEYYRLQREIRIKDLENGQVYNSKSLGSVAYKSIAWNSKTCFTYMYCNGNNELKREIFIPLFYADDRAIIHEMIHSVMSSPLFLLDRNNSCVLKYKFGLCASDDSITDLLEECITEIEAKRIYSNIKKKGISLIDCLYLYKSSLCFYDNFIPYIIEFYKLFKDDIINARITLNLRQLEHILGNEEYNNFLSLLKDFYDNYYDSEKSFYKLFMKQSIDKMGKN